MSERKIDKVDDGRGLSPWILDTEPRMRMRVRMRTGVMLISCAYLGVGFAQEASTNKPPTASETAIEGTAVSPRSRATNAVAQPAIAVPPGRVVVGGAIPKAVRSKNVLQMLNPAAPKEYGDGTDVLALHPMTGEAQGVTLFSITCPQRANQPKPKKNKAAPRTSGK